MLLFYSVDDEVVESELLTKNIQILGIPDKDIKDYDKDGNSSHTFDGRYTLQALFNSDTFFPPDFLAVIYIIG